MTRKSVSYAMLAGAAGLLFAGAPARAAIDWASVPGKSIVLFYPGQSSYEWALTESSMSGAKAFRTEGKNCDTCHVGEEKDMGPQIVTGQPRVFKTGEKPSIEPTPIAGKPGSIPATVKFANDGKSLFVHVEFQEGSQPDAKQDPASATKVTVMFIPKTAKEATRTGCWAACHEDATTMPAAGGAERTKYLPGTRAKVTRQGGGDALKPADELAKMKADGYMLEYWQARLNPGKPAVGVTGTIFDKRQEVSPNQVTAEATGSGGNWSVTLSGPLNAGGGLIAFQPGQTYQVAIAIHAGHTARRFHYVSYERTLAIDSGSADFVAVKK